MMTITMSSRGPRRSNLGRGSFRVVRVDRNGAPELLVGCQPPFDGVVVDAATTALAYSGLGWTFQP